MKKKILSLTLLYSFLNVFSQNTYAFFGSYNWDKSTEGIYVYQLNPKNGKLTKVSSVTGILNPSFLTLSSKGDFLYACTESKTPNSGSVSSFSFNPENGTLKYLNHQKSGSENPVYVSISKDGKWLANANYTEGSVSIYPIGENGEIQTLTQNIRYTEGSVDSDRQDRSHVHAAVFSPISDQLFLPDLGADKIRIYDFKSNLSEPLQPSQQDFVAAIPGSGPRHFTFHPNGKFAYCIDELSGTLNVYEYENKTLKGIQRINSHQEKIKDTFESSDVHVSPDGKFLYSSNRGKENNIAIFSINSDGLLKNIGFQSTFGKHPRTFGLSENGDFLIVTNVNSNNAVVFRRNPETGLLKKVDKVKMMHPTNVKIKTY